MHGLQNKAYFSHLWMHFRSKHESLNDDLRHHSALKLLPRAITTLNVVAIPPNDFPWMDDRKMIQSLYIWWMF